MNTLYIHHVLIAVDDLERARKFYTDVLELQELHRPNFEFPGIWYMIGDGQQELHINVRSEATLRRDKWIDRNDIHFALRVKSYRDTVAWLGSKDFRDDVPDNDLRKVQLRPRPRPQYHRIPLRENGLRTTNLPNRSEEQEFAYKNSRLPAISGTGH